MDLLARAEELASELQNFTDAALASRPMDVKLAGDMLYILVARLRAAEEVCEATDPMTLATYYQAWRALVDGDKEGT